MKKLIVVAGVAGVVAALVYWYRTPFVMTERGRRPEDFPVRRPQTNNWNESTNEAVRGDTGI